MRFIHYLNELRESAAKRVWTTANASEVAEKAYDLTLNKFNNLTRNKKSSPRAKNKTEPKMKLRGVNCRSYFKAFLKRVAWSFKTRPPTSQIEEEARAAMILQGLVRRHFYLSLLEVERSANPFWSRYNWRVKGGTICVWLPISLRGRERREWLGKNIDHPDPRRSGERERIQSTIGRELVREKFVPFSEVPHIPKEEEIPPWPKPGHPFGKSLAEAVAEEKARNIRLQRRSIRALGGERLKQLILRIFKDLISGKYEDRKVAGQFGLSKATFSRFAGSRWLSTESVIPGLWRNTAEVLSTQPIFKKVAISTGVWEQVKRTLERGERGNQS